MKNKLHSIILALTIGLVSVSKAQSFQKQQMDINFGFGLGSTFIKSGAKQVIPAISTSFDYGVTDAISVGAYLGYAAATYEYMGVDWCPNGNGNGNAFGNYYNYTDTYRWKFSIVGLRGAYHFAKLIPADKLDLYAGLMAGANFAKSTYSSNNPCGEHTPFPAHKYGGFIWSVFGGARYRFTEHIGVFTELGYGISYVTLGLNLKF